ncbi:MAG: hypothetical protein J3R72DRAFT_14075 [Linnemannia gamsii]|nr:MAG: hypothetical protein J3R72DRAFT_14075 [Linnemannia gamsii]
MTMLLTTIDLINPNPNTTTTTAWMDSWGSYKDVTMFQAICGYLPGQEPFAVGLAVDGYYGMTLGGSSMGNMVPFDNGTSTIGGVEWRYFRSRFRNYNNHVVPGYKYPISMDPETQLGVVIGALWVSWSLQTSFGVLTAGLLGLGWRRRSTTLTGIRTS